MELRHIRYFLRVAEDRHFGRAATALGISQPPLSQQIRALEDELGVALFDRTTRRVELTEAGKLFLPEARATIAQAGHAIDVAQRAQLGEIGELSIAFVSSVPFVPTVAQALTAFHRDYPNVHLNLVELTRDVQIDGLLHRSIDIGFFRGTVPSDLPLELVANLLLEESLVIAVRDDHPLAQRAGPLKIEDLSGVPLVQYDPTLGAGFNDHLRTIFRRRGLDFRVSQETGGLASLLGLVAAGFGVSILPRCLQTIRTDNVTYRALDIPEAVSRLWFVHHARPSKTAQRFSEAMGRGL